MQSEHKPYYVVVYDFHICKEVYRRSHTDFYSLALKDFNAQRRQAKAGAYGRDRAGVIVAIVDKNDIPVNDGYVLYEVIEHYQPCVNRATERVGGR